MNGAERIRLHQVQEARLDAKKMGKWTNSLQQGVGVNTFIPAGGYVIIDSAVSSESSARTRTRKTPYLAP